MNNYKALNEAVVNYIAQAESEENIGDYVGALESLRKLKQFVDGFLDSASKSLTSSAKAKAAYDRRVL